MLKLKINYNSFLIHTSAYLIICTLLLSCAQVVNPGGGPLDRTPPKAFKYAPDSASLNFRSKQFRVLFNEYIQLKDINNQLIVSPPLKHQPDVKVKGKEVIVDINDTLAPNTTYAFNFGSSIADITESNLLDNFQYVFSTGPFIDSISLFGTVKDAFTLAPEKGVLVMLYNTYDDSVPLKKLPNYFAKTKDDGSFRINNISSGKYKVFALKDINANYLYDSQDESIAFLDTLVDLRKNNNANLFLFKEIPKKQFIKRASAIEFGHIQVVFNKPLTDLLLTPLNFIPKNNDWKMEEISKAKDTLNLWLPGFEKDSIRLVLSDDKKVLDTVEIAMPSKNVKGRGKGFGLTYTSNVTGGLFDLNREVVIKFNHPIKYYKSDSLNKRLNPELIGRLDEYVVGERIKIGSYKWDSCSHQDPGIGEVLVSPIRVCNWKEEIEYKFLISPNKVEDIFGLKNDSIKIQFKTKQFKEYGSLKLKIRKSTLDSKLQIQLLDDKGGVVSQDHLNEGRVEVSKGSCLSEFILDSKQIFYSKIYSFIVPGNYKLRVFMDLDKDSKWTTGDYLKHQQPEKVIYSVPITIRSNWDLEQVWEIKE